MSSDKFTYLIYQQIQGQISSEDATRLKDWLDSSEENKTIKHEIEATIKAADQYTPLFPIDLNDEYNALRLKMDIHAKNEINTKSDGKRFILWSLAFIIISFIAFFAYSYLNDAQAPRNIKTMAGEFESINLSDGSIVYLNENSSLEYNIDTNDETRNVRLQGEAFFDVAQDPTKPFIVELQSSNVEVLGTSFNIRARPIEDHATVTVATGLVRFSTNDSKSSVDLKPYEEGQFDYKSTIITKTEVNNLNSMSWQSKKLEFKNEPLTEVFKVLEKHFNIVIDCKNTNLEICKFSMTQRKADLNAVLKSLEAVYHIKVKKKSKDNYEITQGSCK